MDNDKPKIYKRPDVLKKINAESILAIERGLLGDLPDRFKPKPPVPVRGRPNTLQLVTKQPGLLSSCLPVVIETPSSEPLTPTDPLDEEVSSLKKSFSFRDKLSRISFFGHKDKPEKPKWQTIQENELKPDEFRDTDKPRIKEKAKAEQDNKSSKRFWIFRNKELLENKKHTPIYKRSKSFEFLPRALDEGDEDCFKDKKPLSKNHSYVFGSTDTMGDAWTSNESLEYISNVYYDNDDTVFLKSIKEFPSELSSANNSSLSTATSASSGLVANIFKRGSVQDLLDEFEKTADMFSENYLSDSETYTKPKKETVQEKRRSSSYDRLCLPSPKIVPMSKVDELSEDFKKELAKALEVKREVRSPSARRGSVTDWFVLEDNQTIDHRPPGLKVHHHSEMNKYKRAQKKPINRVRRISSTKYWISPEESVVYTREVRPPLVIPRITQYRAPRRDTRPVAASYEECQESKPITVKSSVRQYERLQDWNFPEGPRRDERYTPSAESPPFQRLHKKMSGSTENLLAARRPVHLPLPTYSSGDSLDIEVRGTSGTRPRKSKSLVPSKRGLRSPVPTPRTMVPEMIINDGFTVIHEGTVKRTKFFEGGKKSKKHWVECYMVLTSSALYFYKDLRTYHASKMLKPPGTPPSPTAPRPEIILALKNAHVIQCVQSQTRRYMKSIELTVSHDRYLLQDESEEGARRWLREIQNIIYKLGPPTDDNLSIQNQSSNTDLESLGRTPPASRHSNRSKHKGEAKKSATEKTAIEKNHMEKSPTDKSRKSPTEKNPNTSREKNLKNQMEKNQKSPTEKSQKSPTEKSHKIPSENIHSKLMDFFGSSHNLSDKHDKAEKKNNTKTPLQKNSTKDSHSSKNNDSKRSSSGGSSNEDLSDCTESANKSHVKSRLKKFFLRRPSMEQLIKKGIYKDEPVFGRNLSQVCPTDVSPRVPPFVVACIKEIESSEENMCTDGLYRASGNLSQVQKIRLDIDQNKLSVIEDNADIHVLTGSLKLFFRELKEPLIPCNLFDRVLAACSIKPREAKIKEFREIVNALPQCNRDTLKYLLEHLLRVTKYSERNRMHTANLAIVFGPTLLWAPAEQAHNIAIDCIQQNNVVDTLLTEFNEIFAEDGKGRRKS